MLEVPDVVMADVASSFSVMVTLPESSPSDISSWKDNRSDHYHRWTRSKILEGGVVSFPEGVGVNF